MTPPREEILRALQREAEQGEQTLAPNHYLVFVAPAAVEDLRVHAGPLARRQAEFLAEQRWGVCDEVVVEFEAAADVPTGEFRVEAQVRKARHRRADEAGKGVGLLVGDGRRYTVQSGATVIGRGRQADLRLRDEGVSRRHACLHYDGRQLVVTDLGSTNGTTVNDRPVRDAVLVGAGDRIQIGSVTLTVS
jgi:hypothetical protein